MEGGSAGVIASERGVMRIVVGVGVEGSQITGGKEEEAATEANTVGGAAGFLVGAEK